MRSECSFCDLFTMILVEGSDESYPGFLRWGRLPAFIFIHEVLPLKDSRRKQELLFTDRKQGLADVRKKTVAVVKQGCSSFKEREERQSLLLEFPSHQ